MLVFELFRSLKGAVVNPLRMIERFCDQHHASLYYKHDKALFVKKVCLKRNFHLEVRQMVLFALKQASGLAHGPVV